MPREAVLAPSVDEYTLPTINEESAQNGGIAPELLVRCATGPRPLEVSNVLRYCEVVWVRDRHEESASGATDAALVGLLQ